jgi:Flp pilus assembly protein TadD
VITAPDYAAAAAASRRLQKWTAGCVGVFVLGLGALWLTQDPEPVAVSRATQAVDPLAMRRQPSVPTAAPAAVADAAPLERPFLESSGTGAITYKSGDLASSLAAYQAAVDRNPQDAESWSNLGQVLVRLNRVPEAIPNFERAIAILPDRWAYRFNLARAMGLVGRWDEAVAGYRRAAGLFPGDSVTTFNLALALHKKGDEAAAVAEYRRAISLAPEDAPSRMALAISLEHLGKSAEAAAAYQEYLRLSPAAPDGDKVRARIALLSAPPPAPMAPQPPANSASAGPG